jgi:hypothetical protein
VLASDLYVYPSQINNSLPVSQSTSLVFALRADANIKKLLDHVDNPAGALPSP